MLNFKVFKQAGFTLGLLLTGASYIGHCHDGVDAVVLSECTPHQQISFWFIDGAASCFDGRHESPFRESYLIKG